MIIKINKNSYPEQLIFCFKNIKQIFFLSFMDYKIRYRRTILGPLWPIIQIFFSSILISIIWSILFKQNLGNYFLKIFFNLAIWQLIISTVLESPKLFFGSYKNHFINLSNPLLFYNFRAIINKLIAFLHNVPFFIIVLIYLGIFPNLLFFFIGIFLLILNLLWISAILGIICARYRDISQLINSLSTTLTLITPVVWNKNMLGEYANYAYLNPFTSLLEIVTLPITNLEINLYPFALSILFIIVGHLILFLILKYFGKKIVFWSY